MCLNCVLITGLYKKVLDKHVISLELHFALLIDLVLLIDMSKTYVKKIGNEVLEQVNACTYFFMH